MATMSARYTVIDGEVVAQERGGVRHQLVPDALGSTVALYDDSGTKTDTFTYWPYGENSGRTGNTTIKFQYVGGIGYYQDNQEKTYIRKRYLSRNYKTWITKDPSRFYFLHSNLYNYCNSNPVNLIDPSGLSPVSPIISYPIISPNYMFALQELCNNIGECLYHNYDFKWFRDKVNYGGDWDYKFHYKPEQDWYYFGNFNYGAAGAACGFTLPRLQNEAGKAQCDRKERENDPNLPSEGTPGWAYGFIGGKWPYGDDPNDSRQIALGYHYYEWLKSTGFKICYQLDGLWPHDGLHSKGPLPPYARSRRS